MTNSKWNEFKTWEEENKEIARIDNLPEDIFALIPQMLTRNPSNRPNASQILPSMVLIFIIFSYHN